MTVLLGSQVQSATIDQMYLATVGHHSQDYDPNIGYLRDFLIMPSANHYVLSNGSTWGAGAGFHPYTYAPVPEVMLVDGLLNYELLAPANGVLFTNTDYNSGNHSAQGTLGVTGPLVMVAEVGGTTATMSGFLEVLSNEETWYGQPRFNYYSASVGDLVYFELDFVLLNSVFTVDLFDHAFNYNVSGVVDFTRVVPIPSTLLLMLSGLGLLTMRIRII